MKTVLCCCCNPSVGCILCGIISVVGFGTLYIFISCFMCLMSDGLTIRGTTACFTLVKITFSVRCVEARVK